MPTWAQAIMGIIAFGTLFVLFTQEDRNQRRQFREG
ncbi:hypothetical protein PQC38_gp029 [Aeromonas phage BUCT695]|nr:hypothetical protein PQC38_gp029 [Aeromonas phage BUCT695]UIW10505.1 hypothetical protein [Aeromonas phage BUCT695]